MDAHPSQTTARESSQMALPALVAADSTSYAAPLRPRVSAWSNSQDAQ